MAGADAAAHQAAQTASAAMKLFLCCNITISLAVPDRAVRFDQRRPIGGIIALPDWKGNAT
jgi:hypothetical protein